MVTRTFITKSNTIFLGSKDNFGNNPIGMLTYGKTVSRCLLWFDMTNFKKEGEHFLKLTNCGSIDQRTFDEMVYTTNDFEPKERASSFDIMAFRIPEEWDAGKGFDKSTDFWLIGKNACSKHGSNWYYAFDGKTWGTELNELGTTIPQEGIFDIEYLESEYSKFKNGEKSIIINKQHFDKGNEDININISSYINGVLNNEYENYGICIAFVPTLEQTEQKYTQYYGFFTNNTNTFFHPIIESRYNDTIIDDRYQFYIGKTNRLYFFAVLGGILCDLEEEPTCEINGSKMSVKRANKGVYFAEVKPNDIKAKDNEILYDVWSNLKYDGEILNDVELEFITHKKEDYYQLGEYTTINKNIKPSLSGINDNEKINQGDERIIDVKFKIPYSQNYELLKNSEYRLYVKDGEREIDVISWDKINVIGKNNVFKIKTSELIPNNYYVDIKAQIGETMRIFKNQLKFTIINNITSIKK